MSFRLGFRGWLVVAGGLLFASGGSLGFLAGSLIPCSVRDGKDPVEEAFTPPAAPTGALLHFTNEEIYRRLDLGPEQRTSADRILSAHFQELKDLRDRRLALGRKVEEDLLALLDEHQRDRMREIVLSFNTDDINERVSKKMSFYKFQLDLSPQQEDEVYSILLADQFAKDELFRRCRGKMGRQEGHEEMKKGIEALNEDRSRKLHAMLSTVQFEKFRQFEESKGWGRGKEKGKDGDRGRKGSRDGRPVETRAPDGPPDGPPDGKGPEDCAELDARGPDSKEPGKPPPPPGPPPHP